MAVKNVDKAIRILEKENPNPSNGLTDEVFYYSCDPTNGVDVGIQSYNSEVNYCGEGKIEPVLTISNTGSEAVTTCIIETIVDGNVISVFNWEGYLPFLGYIALIPAIGFLYIFIFGKRKQGAETFNQPIWWDYMRPIHSFLYFYFAYMAINKKK